MCISLFYIFSLFPKNNFFKLNFLKNIDIPIKQISKSTNIIPLSKNAKAITSSSDNPNDLDVTKRTASLKPKDPGVILISRDTPDIHVYKIISNIFPTFSIDINSKYITNIFTNILAKAKSINCKNSFLFFTIKSHPPKNLSKKEMTLNIIPLLCLNIFLKGNLRNINTTIPKITAKKNSIKDIYVC